MNRSLKQLKVFVTIAQEKSFSHAGECIGLGQSAVSHSVEEPENRTDVRLLDRITCEAVLTDVGQQLALRLKRLLDELNSTLRDTGRMGQQLGGKVRVTASQTIPARLIPQCIAEDHRCYLDIQLALHNRPQQWAMESTRRGDVDFGTVIDPGPVDDLQREAIPFEPFSLLCHRDSALVVEDYVPWQALQGAKLVLQDHASGSRPPIDIALMRNDIRADIVQEVGHPATLLPMIAVGIGISILPALVLSLSEGSLLAVKRTAPVAERQLMLVRKRNHLLSTAAEVLWDVV